jgi:hypothetical protein
LLPLYLAGLVAAVVAASVQQGHPAGWLTRSGVPGTLPDWLTSYLIYLGVWIMMMYTVDYTRLGAPRDERFHGTVTFGWVLYAFTFGLDGLVGIYLLSAYHIAGSESGVVDAMIKALGPVGLLAIPVSPTRINTANYHLASSNLSDAAERLLRLRLPRPVWVVVAGVLATCSC